MHVQALLSSPSHALDDVECMSTFIPLEQLSLCQISQVLSLTCFEKTPVNSLFLKEKADPEDPAIGK